MANKKEKGKIKRYLHPNEAWVVDLWRTKFRFGVLHLKIKDGIPQEFEKIVIKFRPPKDYNLGEQENERDTKNNSQNQTSAGEDE